MADNDMLDLRETQRWRAVKREYGGQLLDQKERICGEIVRQYLSKKADPMVFVGLAGELSQVTQLLTKLDRNITEAEREVQHAL